MESTARGSQHVKYWVELYTNSCAVFETVRTSEDPRDNPIRVLETAKVSITEYTQHGLQCLF